MDSLWTHHYIYGNTVRCRAQQGEILCLPGMRHDVAVKPKGVRRVRCGLAMLAALPTCPPNATPPNTKLKRPASPPLHTTAPPPKTSQNKGRLTFPGNG